MPLRNRLRLRHKKASRPISERRIGLSRLAHLLPKAAVLPIALFAGGTAMAAAYWTYDIHVEQTYGAIDEPLETGSVDSGSVDSVN